MGEGPSGDETSRDKSLSRREQAAQLPSDRSLLLALAGGDESALAPLYDRYARAVFTLLVRIVSDRPTAEELQQEVFISVWRRADSFDPARGNVLPWLLGIAHHAALNELRRQRRRPRLVPPADPTRADHELLQVPDPQPVPEDAAWLAVRRDDLRRSLGQLSDEERTIVDLYAAGYSQSEIAKQLDLPLGTVKTRMRRALHRLREAAERREFEWD